MKKKKISKGPSLSKIKSKADKLGTQYEEVKAIISRYDEKEAATKASILDFASKVGSPIGKSVLVTGNEFEIGYQIRGGGAKADPEKVRKKLSPKLRKRVFKTVEVLDENELASLVMEGKITSDEFKEMVDEKPPVRAVTVKRLGTTK